MKYSEKLRDPRWQKKRLEILQRDNFHCQICFDDKSTLHVHHFVYVNGDPWEIENIHLITLCEQCHKNEEENKSATEAKLIRGLRMSRFTNDALDELLEAIVCSRFDATHDPHRAILRFALVEAWDDLREMYFESIKPATA